MNTIATAVIEVRTAPAVVEHAEASVVRPAPRAAPGSGPLNQGMGLMRRSQPWVSRLARSAPATPEIASAATSTTFLRSVFMPMSSSQRTISGLRRHEKIAYSAHLGNLYHVNLIKQWAEAIVCLKEAARSEGAKKCLHVSPWRTETFAGRKHLAQSQDSSEYFPNLAAISLTVTVCKSQSECALGYFVRQMSHDWTK
jgi:hypothetical protein